MAIEFTKDQQRVIDLRDCNILVSAAAGSGKTAVLVERIIKRLTKENPPVNVDELLVVTFSEAAASEMRERIHDAIEKALAENPDDEHLQRQSALIYQANITTVHSFCMSVVREYFHVIDLDPGFRVGEEGELKLLMQDVVEQVLETAYENAQPEFLNFVENFAAGKNDRNLENMILQLHKFSESYPYPEDWLDGCVEQYEISTQQALEEKPFVKEILEETKKIFSDLQERMQYGITICESEEGPIAYKEALLSDLVQLEKLLAVETFGEMAQQLQKLNIATLGRNKKGEVSEEKIEQVKAIRKETKDFLQALKADYFSETFEDILEDTGIAKSNVKVLVDLVKQFNATYLSEKRKKNLIDFGDMEHYALQILGQKVDGKTVPSEVARSYQTKFTEIMIDEYQDSNFLQEEIMKCVSGVSEGNYNVFMVGDVKQSIYRFRLSRPELFVEKYNQYRPDKGEQRRIDLHKNFRSREEVLTSTNFVFEQIMSPSLGGVEYDEKAALHVGAAYEARSGNETEVLLIDMPGSKTAERMEIEAEVIAEKIKELKEHHEVFDKKTGTYRKVQNRDIVILARGLKDWGDVLSRVLNGAGIPTYASSKEGYFQTQEIQLLLNFLKILDNPLQDIPFTSILTSVFVGITTEQLALIRNHASKRTMYDCVLQYVKDGPSEELQQCLQAFLQMFERFRDMVPYTAIHVLLGQLLRESGYADYIAMLPGGVQRAANLEMLLEKAVAFEGTSYKGLFNFVRYMELLEKYEIDYGEANIMDEEMDVVRLMTIHKSKGLEFPIVFVTGLGKGFNTKDSNAGVLLHSEWGIGIDSIDARMRTKAPTLLKKAIKKRIQRETAGEELRVLYVAMTRAKEKLFLVGCVSDLEKRVCEMIPLQSHREKQLPYYNMIGSKGFLDWILGSLYRNQCFAGILEQFHIPVAFQNPLFLQKLPISVQRITLDDLTEQEIQTMVSNSYTKAMLRAWDTEKTYDATTKQQLEEQLTYRYPYEQEQRIKQKLSVSELKKRIYLEEEGEDAYQEEVIIPLLPKFLQEEGELTGASRGTAYHKLLELLDFTKEYDEESLYREILQKQEEKRLTEEMASCIRVADILAFLHSEIGKRVQRASRAGKCFVEQPFVLGLKAKDVYPDIESEETVLVQGIIDLYFEEDGELVVLDYKTDRVFKAEELREKYHSQLEYYAEALTRLTGMPVKEKIIYSFTLREEIGV